MTETRRYYTGLIFFIVMILLTIVRIVFTTDIASSFTDNQIDIFYTLITQVICMGAVPAALYVILVLRKENRPTADILKDFKYRLPSPLIILLTFIAGITFFFATMGVSAIWNIFLILGGYTGIASPGTIFDSAQDLVLWVAIIACLPGMFEELTHRGLLAGTYSESSEGEGVILSALMFALMHQDIRQFGYAFVGGVVMGLFYVKSRSIIPPMILHFTNNALGTVIDYSSQTGGVIGKQYESLFSSGAIGLLLFLVIWLASCGLLILIYILTDIISSKKFKTEPTWNKRLKFKFDIRKEDVFLYGAFALGISTTLFSLVWGIMR